MSGAQDSDHSSTHHPNYVGIWLVLVVLFAASVVSAYLGANRLATALVFAIATAKAFLVISNYMHLRFEPRWIVVLMLGAFICAAILFVTLIPDIVHVYGA